MKVIQHIKKGNISYVSHIDSMRVLQRTLIRANINVKLSEGFNPHPITYTSHPLPLGVESEQEFFVVANDDLSAEQVLNAFNNNVPSGMMAVKCYDCIKNPNFAKNVNYCEYLVKGNFFPYKNDIESLAKSKNWIIKYDFKGTEKEQDIAPLINS
ncbi:MAG: TIGR03936 family radical SAM-associated protein, partial [Clostridia bacterium]|nr:TIGR03936 family radical SAM-associated protein [Clostridia bacterium]